MNKQITILLVLLGAVYADINDQLVAHYPLAGNLNDATGNYQQAQNVGTSWTVDQNGNPNSAVNFGGTNKLLSLPKEAINGLVDFTLCFWTKSSEISQISRTLAYLKNQSSQNLISFQQGNVVINSSIKQQQFLLNNYLLTGHWQHICYSRDVVNKQYNVYADGQLYQTLDTSEVEDGLHVDVTDFLIGYYKTSGYFYERFQYYGSLYDLRVYSRAFTAADADEVRDATDGLATDDQTCTNYLAELKPGVITEDITLQLVPLGQYYVHQYNIYFNAFNFDKSCFKSYVFLGNNLIYHSVNNNQISIRFPWDDAISKGCIQVTPTQQQCQFRIQVQYKDEVQHQKLFTSIINTPNLDDLSDQLTLNIINDEDESLQQFDQTIETQLQLCSDIYCSQYIYPSEIVRNTDVYVEFRVNTPGYDQYYPIHKRLTIDGFNVAIQNQATIDLWEEQGRIVYHIRPPIASPTALLVIGISISKTNPQGRRILQEQQVNVLDEQKDNIGKYMRVQIVDHDGKLVEHKQKEGDSDENVTIAIIGAVAALVLVISLTGIGVFYKLRKTKSQNLQNSQQGQQLEPSTPQSTNSRENKFNIQVE